MTSAIHLQESLLIDVKTFAVVDSVMLDDDSLLGHLSAKAASTGSAELSSADGMYDGIASAMAVPIFRGGHVVSVVAFALAAADVGTGVFEIWEPVGIYEEVRLRTGYFADLERFCNVSSFVRFEKGSGLPGQAWASHCGVIHDDLPNHAGFLRAAGASAGLLRMALAIPVIDISDAGISEASDERMTSVATLISSDATPIAKGYEVWSVDGDEFTLRSCAYQRLSTQAHLKPGCVLPGDEGWPSVLRHHHGAIVVDDEASMGVGRNDATESANAMLLIPFYIGERLDSVTVFLF